jgi:hypothetical protein
MMKSNFGCRFNCAPVADPVQGLLKITQHNNMRSGRVVGHDQRLLEEKVELIQGPATENYSHSIVAGGFPQMS